jgi:hypothetical protein
MIACHLSSFVKWELWVVYTWSKIQKLMGMIRCRFINDLFGKAL